MDNRVCRLTGAEFPLFAFSHCRDVVAAVSKAGGFGVLGATRFSPDQLEEELAWIDAHVGGAPYGVDVIVPETIDPRVAALQDNATRAAAIDPKYAEFAADLLERYGIEAPRAVTPLRERMGITPENGMALMEVAFRHPIRLIANALGIAPPAMIAEGKRRGVPVAALVGAKEHAIRQAEAGVDIIVAQGGEAGGHCGEVSTLVLIPEVVRALEQAGYDTPVLAAGGIMTGGQMAAMIAAGAQGAWTGSVWLATPESETSEAFREKMIAARSRDTQAGPPAAHRLARGVGRRRGSRCIADAVDGYGLRARVPPHRTRRRSRQSAGARARQLFRRPGRGPSRRSAARPRGGPVVPRGVRRGGRTAGRIARLTG
jgi:NAD(P)H-dependent flavin oxidoreductase YrpB (nitropropane dioxygenase family)